MNVTRDVVKDLLSLYLAGEASADTRVFVEEYLQRDPSLAREVEAARIDQPELPPTPPPDATAEKLALDRTRQLLKTRTSTMAVAVVFTLIPLAFVLEDSSITFLLIRDAPIIGLTWWATAVVMWICHLYIRRRLRVSGL
ncbi:MAG: hypothetical protein EHM61_28170 [Acidobacteria bacterium]|nr:MAG: hypothetical protein EHM61_28170 [Acidobacteriota bacterium]